MGAVDEGIGERGVFEESAGQEGGVGIRVSC